MGEHDDVGVDTHDGTGPSDVWVDDVFAQEGRGDVGRIDGDEYGGVEGGGLGIVQILELRNGLLLSFLGVWTALDGARDTGHDVAWR